MHSIEDGEIVWSDRSALLQHRMTQTHATMFATQSGQRTPAGRPKDTGSDRKLFCKFFHSGSCRETGDSHVDPMTGLTYVHDQAGRRK